MLSVASLASYCIVIALNNVIENANGEMYGLANLLSPCNDTNATSSLPIELYHKTIHISLVVFCSIYMLLVILAIIYQVIVIILQLCQINFKYLYSTVRLYYTVEIQNCILTSKVKKDNLLFVFSL